MAGEGLMMGDAGEVQFDGNFVHGKPHGKLVV
jgi:hypothetical protein